MQILYIYHNLSHARPYANSIQIYQNLLKQANFYKSTIYSRTQDLYQFSLKALV